MSFLEPAALLFSALYAVLLALHLWERRRPAFEVPSLLLWETVPEDRIRVSRFRPTALFWLQFILLTALIAGLARPYVGHSGGGGQARHIFILDVSASMQTHEAGGTRFDQARSALSRRLTNLPPDDEAMLVTAANHATVAAPFSRDHAAMIDYLETLTPLDTGTNLDVALAIARSAAERTDRPTSIELFTDTPPSDLDSHLRDGIGVVQIGTNDNNIGIEGLQIDQSRFQDQGEARANILVQNFSAREQHGLLTLRFKEQVLSQRGFSLAPHGTQAFLVEHLSGPGILHAHLDVDDALPADNDAYGWVRTATPLRVLVVSESAPLRAELERIARVTPNLEFRFLSPEAFAPGQTVNADVVLLHQFTPDAGFERPSLHLFPPQHSRLFPPHGTVPELPILDWNETHAALRGLQFMTPQVVRPVEIIEVPAWAEVLLNSRDGTQTIPLAVAGEYQGHRTACVAFDWPAEGLLGADRVDLLLFFVDLLNWLAPPDSPVPVLHTGDRHTIADLPPGPRRVLDPRGQTSIVPADRPLTLEPLYAGAYQVTVGGTTRRVLANFLDPAESDIGRQATGPPQIARPFPAAPTQPPTRPDAGHSLFGIAAVLLLLEWLAAGLGSR